MNAYLVGSSAGFASIDTGPRGSESDILGAPRGLDLQTLLQGTVPSGPAVGALITAVRTSTAGLASVRQVELTIDGRSVPLSRLTDEEIAKLLPELTA